MKLATNNESTEEISDNIFLEILWRLPEVVRDVEYEELELLLTDDKTIQKLNKKYRKKDKPTDVLSFPLNDPVSLGQIVISVDRAKEQAKELGQSLEEELKFLFAHALLHLLGYDHDNSKDEEEMLNRTYKLLNRTQ